MSDARSFMTRGGARLNVDADGDGPVMLFQHGLYGDAGQAREAFSPETGYQRIKVDARGHGSSEPGDLGKLSIATFTDDMADFIEQELDGPVVAGGISMGALIALRLAVKRPDLFQGAGDHTAGMGDVFRTNMVPNTEVGRLLKTLDPEAAKAAFLTGATGQHLAAEAPDNLARPSASSRVSPSRSPRPCSRPFRMTVPVSRRTTSRVSRSRPS